MSNNTSSRTRCPRSQRQLSKLPTRKFYGHRHLATYIKLIKLRPVLPKSFSANQPKTIRLFPLSNYTFGTKENQPEEDPSVLARLKRLEEHYEQHGMRRTCEGVLVCHEHNHPHILMLQIANAFFKL